MISVARLSLSGETQQTYPSAHPAIASANSALLPSLDGTELVVAADHGLALFANNGTFLRDIGPSAKACSPERWWDRHRPGRLVREPVCQFERRARTVARARRRSGADPADLPQASGLR